MIGGYVGIYAGCTRVQGLGFKDPNNRVLGPKYNEYYSIWALKPYYLGPWTLGKDKAFVALDFLVLEEECGGGVGSKVVVYMGIH